MKKGICASLCMLLMAAVILTGCGKGGDYKKAMSMYENGQFEEAAEKFTDLGNYENSQDMVIACRYEAARTMFDAGNYEEAKKAFSELGDYENSADFVSECDYYTASTLLEAGDYESAIAIFETIPDYKDSQEKIRSANKELMIQKYGPVLQALNGKTWLFNGGSNTILNKISFTDEEAEIAQVSYDGNGKHDNGSNTCAFTVDDKKILITLADGSEIEIPYTLEGDSIRLEKDKYFTLEEIDAGIQGYWNLRKTSNLLGKISTNEHNIYFNNGKVISESAAEAYGGAPGEYYYYGPETGSYTLNFGGINTEMRHGSEWFYNIIDGKVTILHYDKVCSPYDHLPGENGYNF